jgi:hypothetical protein
MKNNFRVTDEIVKKAVSKGNVNVEATLDCDIRKINNFYDLFSSILMDYCDILSENYVINIFSHYFSKLKNVGASPFSGPKTRGGYHEHKKWPNGTKSSKIKKKIYIINSYKFN